MVDTQGGFVAGPGRIPIVGVGASAGGVEALEGFFRGMPDDPGIGVVVVTHLNPDRESLLHEIIARFTGLTVHVALDGATVLANHVYVMPADALMTVVDGRLCLQRHDGGRRERKPVDVFFTALALDQGEYAGGVVLSGGDGDGTLGIKVIKERGGITLAQTRSGYGPAHPDMPDHAILTGYVDLAVPVVEMGRHLAEFASELRHAAHEMVSEAGQETLRADICAILRSQVGHDFAGYKANTFLRRVQRRMTVVQLGSMAAYVDRLRQDTAEAAALFHDLLINVTSFFRDRAAFDALAATVIPALFEERRADGVVRIWIPGCATGEEVYSIAILMREHMDTLSAVPKVQIFATDIDDAALAVARAGRYPASLLGDVSAERRQRFFVPDGASLMLARDVRDLCIFSPHSVLRDPPFSRMDLVSCRNLLIYFGVQAQSQVIPTFHYALRSGGYLFLGASENISSFRELFGDIDKAHRIFRRRDTASALRLPPNIGAPRMARPEEGRARRPGKESVALRQSVQSQVLDRFAPPHVVINRDGEVVYYSSRTGKYLEAASGAPTRQLQTLVRKGLRLDLRTLFRKVLESSRPASCSNAMVEDEDGRVQYVTLSIEPLLENDGELLFLVLFTDVGPMLSREDAAARALTLRDGQSHQLEEELRDTRERLQSQVEEYETALEELKSSNEELQSVNEEFQSTNEEMEASKEELQSLNEELLTVNTELTVKIDSLDRANNDLQNLFDSTNVATIFLDPKLRIRSFTPAVSRIFHVLPLDRGRPITDLSSLMELPHLTADIAEIMAGRAMVERQVSPGDGKEHFLVRITPYRNASQVVYGAVVTFVDISNLTRAEAQLRILVAELQHRTRNLLGVVQAIARQTLPRGATLDTFNDRLSALGRVQGLISHAANGTIDLRELLELEMRAHGGPTQVNITGPAVALRLHDVQPIALVVHELATNATKYGALRDGNGRLDIEWTVSGPADTPQLSFDWRESGVTMPPGSGEHSGLGRLLIQRSMEAALQARTELTFGADGVHCQIELTLNSPPETPSAGSAERRG